MSEVGSCQLGSWADGGGAHIQQLDMLCKTSDTAGVLKLERTLNGCCLRLLGCDKRHDTINKSRHSLGGHFQKQMISSL